MRLKSLLTGKSCHAAMPESGADPIVAAARLIYGPADDPRAPVAIKSRRSSALPRLTAVKRLTFYRTKWVLRGTFRCLSNRVRERVKGLIAHYVSTQPQVSDDAGEHYPYPAIR